MKTKHSLRVAALLLAAVLLVPLCSILTASPVQADAYSSDSKVQEMEAQIKALNEKIEAQKKKLAEASGNINAQEEEIKNLRELEQVIQDRVDIAEQLVTELEANIAALDQQISDQEENLANTFEEFRSCVRSSYEAGDISYLELLFAADSVNDFMARWEYLSAILRYEQNLMSTYRTEQADLTEQRAVLQVKRDQQTSMEAELLSQKNELVKMDENATLYLNQLKQAYATTEDQYTQYLEDSQAAGEELQKYLEELAKKSEQAFSGEGMIWPLPGFPTITSNYGPRTFYLYGKLVSDNHAGIDISGAGVFGAKIVAVASGTVITATLHSSYGNYVVLDHGGGIYTVYAHASKLLVQKGDVVKQGETIALVGSTGTSTAAHLHFEVRVNGKTQDPIGKGWVVQPKY